MTPLEAVRHEISVELDALERRIGDGSLPAAIEIRVELDRETRMPRAVNCRPEWRRRILGGAVGSRRLSSNGAGSDE